MSRFSLTILACLGVIGSPPTVAAQVITDPNQVRGVVEFSNADPEVVGLLDDPDGEGMVATLVRATSESPAPFTLHESTSMPMTRRQATYEVSVETDPAGIDYKVAVRATLGPNENTYVFQGAVVGPALPEPAPDLLLDFVECASVLRVMFVDAAGQPVVVESVSLRYLPARDDSHWSAAAEGRDGGPVQLMHLVVPSGLLGSRLEVRYRANSVLQTEVVELPAGSACDDITDVTIVVPDLVLRVGRVVGWADLVGWDEQPAPVSEGWLAPGVVASYGPLGAYRTYRYPDDVPPSTQEFAVENLVASDAEDPAVPYDVWALLFVENGGRLTHAKTPSVSVLVEEDQTVDIGDALVSVPAVLEGHVGFAGPDGRVGLGLVHLLGHGEEPVAEYELARIDGGEQGGRGGSAWTTLEGSVDPATSRYVSPYRMPAPVLDGGEADWELRIISAWGTSLRWPRPGMPFVDFYLSYNPRPFSYRPLSAGMTREEDRFYCLSEVTVHFRTESGLLHSPYVHTLIGAVSLDIEDFEPSYNATADAHGSPRSAAAAAETAEVLTLMPAGTARLYPEVFVVGPSGNSTRSTYPPFYLEVGCRQVLNVLTDAWVSIASELPPCASGPEVLVEGEAHAASGISRLHYIVGDGAEVELCTDCGTDYSYSFSAILSPGEDHVRVVATTGLGDLASAEVTTRLLPEVSALDQRPAAEPLRLARASQTTLRLTWEQSAFEAYSIHSGSVDSLWTARAYDHEPLEPCDLASGSADVELPPVDRYYLVSATCGGGQGSLGRDSFGADRGIGIDCP